MTLAEPVRSKLRNAREALEEEGALLSQMKLAECYTLFRERFGPEKLQELDGPNLLETMHLHGSRDSLVYWLEFKDDEDLPGVFGSIAGGSALKFGIYRRKETGVWMTGHAAKQIELSTEDAIGIARRHRDQLVAASALLDSFSEGGSDEDYAGLQKRMEEVAPDVQDSAWGHKYLSLLHHTKLDDYHSDEFHDFHLVKTLQIPPSGRGKYIPAGRFVSMAAELGVPLSHLGTILNRANGKPRRVWRVGTRVTSNGQADVSIWELMRHAGNVAIGWEDLGDLSWVEKKRESKDELKRRMSALTYYAASPQVASRKAGEVFSFLVGMDEGDIVLAADGSRVLGIGKVSGPYSYDPHGLGAAPHRRAVEWLDAAEWSLPHSNEGLRTTFYPIRDPENRVAIEGRLLNPAPEPSPVVVPATARTRSKVRLDGVPGRLQGILDRKGQAILYGPPGTGKTYWARKAARDLAALAAFGAHYDAINETEQAEIEGNGGPALVRSCTFHPSYGYEDFLEGFRPTSGSSGQLSFERRDGMFKRLCREAAEHPDREFYLLVDEINRGDIPRIFGELITLLEMDKRGHSLNLPVSGEVFSVPANVRIIGTMNTADRSIALLDTALRRRFGFVELLPDTQILADAVTGGVPLGPWLRNLNARIREHVGRDARNLQVGHAYLMDRGQPVSDPVRLARIIAEDIIPLLEEYCYEDYEALERILGKGLIDSANQKVRSELFLAGRVEDLLAALVAQFPDIVTTLGAVAHAEDAPEIDPDDEQDDAP
ncbi:AAA family ATPase [Methylobacterium sp. EM32]|uniref:AAA family ATPase n=1 Tax=Methylobacterium sp. EM32 TaxID=3163481 RepID=UPI0033BA35B9